jgi:alcohol dehydrogenase class IV
VKQTPYKNRKGKVMEDNKDLVTDVAENVEQPTEEVAEKTYTQSELNAIVGKRLERNSAKIRKEYDKKYGDLENVLKTATGKESVEEVTESLTQFYESKGIKMPEKPTYNDKDLAVLAKADAEEVIGYGFDEVVEEVDRLTRVGLENMTAREKAYFKALAEHRQSIERQNELSKIGVTEDEFKSKEFQDFAKQFNPTTPIADIFNIYNKMKPKKEIKPMGSMKNTPSEDTGVKDYYSYEEALKFKKEDFDKNPALYEAVKKSMLKW